MKSLKKTIKIVLVSCFIIIMGYSRDFVFKNMNALIQSHELNLSFSMPSPLSFFDGFEYSSLIKIKWVLTVVFTVIYLLISLIAIKVFFRNKKFIRITVGVYIALTLVSAIFMTTGYFFHGISNNMYSISRYLMGMAQSPLVLMILIPAFKISERESIKITN